MTAADPARREKASDLGMLPPDTTGRKTQEREQRSGRTRKSQKVGRAEKTEKASKSERSERSEKSEKSEKSERQGQTQRPPDGGSKKKRSTPRGRRGGRGRKRRAGPMPDRERVMLVHADVKGTQIAVLEEDQIVEHYVTRHDDRSYVGNIYLGRVQNVLPGMEASFVDIGEGRNGVLYAGEVGIAGDDSDEVPRIETVLRSGQAILVQVTKDPMRSKGARLTAQVSLAGRHLVLVPGAETLGVSRRLPDDERTRLRDAAAEMRSDGFGLIVRTAAEGASREDLAKDLERLIEIWKEIDARSKKVKAPSLLYSEPELELRVIRDLFNRDVSRCIVDDPDLESTLRDYIRSTTPDLDHRLELFDGSLPIFEQFRVVEQIRKSLDRKVWLPSGGHLVIDRTEAMTVVDVNTGKFVGKSSLEETVFKTNKEAAVEMARQLRLRDIGGIIVIDFIDMEEETNRGELLKVFRRALEEDRTRTQVFDVSPLGLVQMTRKNVSAGIVEAFSDPCPTCEGRGILIHDVD